MIHYVIRMEPGVQEPDETLALRSGSCRDSAWLLVQILRRLGLAARFVSGYLIQLRADVDPIEGPRGTDKDFTDLHAWAEVYLPGAGWIGMDATSGLFCGEGHLPLCATPHYRSAAPIAGLVEPAQVTFGFDMKVTRMREAPRVTLPFTDEAWSKLDALGETVDRDLVAQDVRLTMGGEPTFVSIDDFDAPEWNTAAVGGDQAGARRDADPAPAGAVRAGRLPALRPGQMVSRREPAALGLRALLAQGRQADLARPAADRRGRRDCGGDGRATLEALAGEVAVRLGIEPDYVIPAYEDAPYWLLRESALPVNVDPSDPKIDDPEERARMVRTFDHGLSRPTGFVLPVQRWNAAAKPAWRSERWPLRRGKLFLVPGDSPVGLRLPMKTLPHVKPSDYPVRSRAGPDGPARRIARADAVPPGRACADRRGTANAKRAVRRRRRGAHRPDHRAARRRAVRLHAADAETRRLSRIARHGRGDRAREKRSDPHRGLYAAVRPAGRLHQGDARSRRHRGQYPSRRVVAPGGGDDDRAV